MSVNIKFVSNTNIDSGNLVLGVNEDSKFPETTAEWDKKTGGSIDKTIKASRFTGKEGQTLVINAPQNTNLDRIILVGLGKEHKEKNLLKIGASVYSCLSNLPQKDAHVAIDGICAENTADAIATIAMGAKIKSWNFNKYHTCKKPEELPAIECITFVANDAKAAESKYNASTPVIDGSFMTREMVAEPSNVMGTEKMLEIAKSLADLGVKIEILDHKKMENLGMHALLGVAQGSSQPPYSVYMEWKGSDNKNDLPLAFVGKGVTFDSGGISIKPGANMDEMKWDMGGAAVVIGLMHALAKRKAKVNVVGAIGLVENMPSGTAQRPGDIVKTMAGLTVEVLNTDAEGRLVLADVLHYVQENYNPKMIIDLATLTGAIIVCLGADRAGMFSNNDELADQLFKCGEETLDLVWRLPTDASYGEDIKSDIADLKNIGSGRGAGSVTAAKFLERFVKNGTPWAHLDIAGVTWASKDTPLVAKGATGFGVRLLDRLVSTYYEKA